MFEIKKITTKKSGMFKKLLDINIIVNRTSVSFESNSKSHVIRYFMS